MRATEGQSPSSRIIDEHFLLWVARVRELTTRPVDIKEAWVVFTVFDAPTKPISPEEYAAELNNERLFTAVCEEK